MTMKSEIDCDFNQSGELISLRFDGVEFASPDGDNSLFLIQLRDFIGNALQLAAADFSKVERCGEKLFFSNCTKLPGSRAEVTVKTGQSEIRWQIAVFPGNDAYKVEWIDFPRVRLRRFDDGKYLLPFAEGTLVDDLVERECSATFGCSESEYPLTGINGFYPGPASVQFEAFYTGSTGLCFLCRDPEHSPKTIDFRPDGKAAVPLLEHFTGGENALRYEVSVIGFRGDWQDAAELYRKWMTKHDPALRSVRLSKRMPRLLAESPVLLIYPVRGTGLDHGDLDPNEFYPYCAALPVVERYRKRWKSPIMPLLMHWEGTAPWAPPHIWPPCGGEAMLTEFIEALHKEGDALGLYGSGIGWTQKSMIDPAYDRTAEFAAHHLDREICVGPRGETYSRICNGPWGQRIGYDLCPAQDFTRSVVAHEIEAASQLKVDYLQYFDQNQGGAAPLCYSVQHGHPTLPGAWHTASMRKLLAEAERVAGETVLGCENGAAEPYLGICRLNDLRSHLAWGASGVPVPLYSYLFHEYTAGFSGNGVCLSDWVDLKRTPFFLQWTIGWNFACGNLISVVLKDGGKIHWHWNLSWSVPEPDQQPLIDLIGNLMKWRHGRAAEYLVAGRMEKKPAVVCGNRTIHLKARRAVEYPAVIASAWSNSGKHALLLVNYGRKNEPCRIDFPYAVHGTIFFANGNTILVLREDSPQITVPPLDAVLLEYSRAQEEV